MIRVAVIGTGTMGQSIAQAFSECAEIERVFLCRSRETSTRNGLDDICRVFEKQIAKGKKTQDEVESCLARIEAGNKELAINSDLLIEAVAEDLDVKRRLFYELDVICPPSCLFTTNTSSLPIRMIGEGLSHILLGMHFFNPVPAMKLVEIITSESTPKNAVDFVMQVARDLGKTPVEVKEAPGFVVNRVLIPMINEAISIYAEGIASVEDIDTAMKLGANHPMGPLALCDLIGLDVVLAILNVMLKETGDNRYLPQAMLKKMVREGRLGRKTGIGFYKYG